MWKSISDWWNRDKIREQQLFAQMHRIVDEAERKRAEERVHLEEQLREQEAARKKAEEQLASAQTELTMHREQDAADEARRNGTEPWVEIKSAEFNDLKGIQIELDWNEAFVVYLRENGINAREDTAVVQKWLLMLYKGLMERLEEEVIEGSDKHFVNDFE